MYELLLISRKSLSPRIGRQARLRPILQRRQYSRTYTRGKITRLNYFKRDFCFEFIKNLQSLQKVKNTDNKK